MKRGYINGLLKSIARLYDCSKNLKIESSNHPKILPLRRRPPYRSFFGEESPDTIGKHSG